MSFLNSTRNKIILILIISSVIFTGWQFGLETGYARILVGVTNFSVSVFKSDTHIELEKIKNTDSYQFKVHTKIDGRKGSYPQETGGFMQPMVIVLSWQIFLFFVLDRKTALRSMVVNIGVFLFFQVLFLAFLTGYYNSDVQQFLFDTMLDSFYIIALILVIKDNIFYSVFKKQVDSQRA